MTGGSGTSDSVPDTAGAGIATSGNSSSGDSDGVAGEHGGNEGGMGYAADGEGASSGATGAEESGAGAGGAAEEAGLPHASLQPGVFDPREVYIWGTLQEGLCGADALTTWWDPTQIQTGFDCEASSSSHVSAVDPKSRELVYRLSSTADSSMHIVYFAPDGDGTGTYPSSPETNDPLVPSTCSSEFNFWAEPAGKGILYRCDDTCTVSACHYFWQSGEELPVPPGYTPLHLGYGGRVLLQDQSYHLWIQDATGQLKLVQVPAPPPILYNTWGAIRAYPGGFWLLRMQGTQLERWSASFDGSMTRDGVYARPKTGTIALADCVLESTGAAYCIVSTSAGGEDDVIIRSEIGGSSYTVVYEEKENPVKLFISGLFTGP
jgi:hypothetical protein